MKLMTYNILNGGEDRFDGIIDIINNESPDFLMINEANTFEREENKKLKLLAEKTGLPNYHLALSGEYDYHVAVFSKLPFSKLEEIKPLMRAGINIVLKTEIGEVSIIGTHLTPYTEAQRLPEIKRIIETQKSFPNKILMGDMNSLSPHDGYDESMIKDFNEMQMKKFTENRKLCFNAIHKIESAGYKDVGFLQKQNKIYTAPTSINEANAHSNMRLDYFFVSENLLEKVINYKVLKDDLTEKSSDHYPVIMELE